MRWKQIWPWGLATWIWSSAGFAETLDADAQVHGFVSQGFIKTSDNNYLAKSERGSFEFSEVGVNLTVTLGDHLRMGAQVFAHDIGPVGNYSPHFDWYYLDYRFFDWLGVRAGRTKLPFGLYNEANDVDAGRVPILLPQSVYPVSNREFLFAQTGGELYSTILLGAAGTLEARLYGGTLFLDTSEASAQFSNFDVPYLIGGRLMWLPPIAGLQLGGSLQNLLLEFDFVPTDAQLETYRQQGQLPADFGGTVQARLPVWLWVLSAELQLQDLQLSAEYSRTSVNYKTNLVLSSNHSESEGFYIMGSYRVSSWFTPGIYYALLRPKVNLPMSDRAARRHDLAITTRYDLTPNWLLKLEGHYMEGTAGLSADLNGGTKPAQLNQNWAVLLIKTTAYF